MLCKRCGECCRTGLKVARFNRKVIKDLTKLWGSTGFWYLVGEREFKLIEPLVWDAIIVKGISTDHDIEIQNTWAKLLSGFWIRTKSGVFKLTMPIPCQFFDEKDDKCTIYTKRPKLCKEFFCK